MDLNITDEDADWLKQYVDKWSDIELRDLIAKLSNLLMNYRIPSEQFQIQLELILLEACDQPNNG